MKNLKKIVVLTLVAASLISTVAFASTTTTITDTSIKDSVGQHQRGPKLGLDEDTKAVVDKMKADGATREEIGEYLVSQGYELPERNEEARGHKLGLDENTKAVVDKMKADGATREEIGEYLVSQGYELPVMPHARGPMGQKRGTRPAGQNKL